MTAQFSIKVFPVDDIHASVLANIDNEYMYFFCTNIADQRVYKTVDKNCFDKDRIRVFTREVSKAMQSLADDDLSGWMTYPKFGMMEYRTILSDPNWI